MSPRNLSYLLSFALLILFLGFGRLILVPPTEPNESAPTETEPAKKTVLKGAEPVMESLLQEAEKPDSLLSAEMKRLVTWVDAGRPLRVAIDGGGGRLYAFRPTRVTTEGFQLSSSPTDEHGADWRVYNGRELLGGGQLGESVSLAVVNDAVSMAVEQDGLRYLIETDPESETLYATALNAALQTAASTGKHSCGVAGCMHQHGEPIAGIRVPEGIPNAEARRVPVSMVMEASGEPGLEANWVDHPYFRLGPQYDASLKDIIILMVSGSTQTGSSSNLSSRAASYLTYAARVADTYERQLGLRYLLQEIVLIANDSGQDDIEYDDSVTPNNSDTGSDDLGALEDWCDTHRPKSVYGWGHAAGWTLVEGSGGGTIGWAWVDAYGSSGSAFSVQERRYDWDVHSHELGHNVGASHTRGGVMNGSLSNNNEDFFRENASSGGYTGAMDIYNYMSSPSRNNVFGPANLRHPEEIPFAVDDSLSTPASTPIVFDPLANDETEVMFGATNVLRLVEVGQVFPKAAGTADVIGNQIRFTPAVGFTGNAWFTYTIAGDVGNGGNGWLHAADVVVRVGGVDSDPGLSPTMSLTDDSVKTDFSGPIRIKPLLNDEGSGRLWSGDVDVLSDIDGTAESYSDFAFELVSATVLSGTGSVSLETREMTRNASAGSGNTGYLIYTPGVNELDVVTIQYTAEDEFGNQSNATITLYRVATVFVEIDRPKLIETEGRVALIHFRRDAVADTSVSETVSFSLGGSVALTGDAADLALAGFDSLDLDQMSGEITIPAGQLSATLQLSASNDGQAEGQESFNLFLTQTESLLVGVEDSVSLTIDDTGSSGTPILTENFDGFTEPSGIGSGAGIEWTNVSGESAPATNWEVQSGTTSSSNTGPNGDNTSGSGNYLYIEASGRSNNNAELLSPEYDLSAESDLFLQFAYHMFGSDMGELHVDVRTNGGAWALDVLSTLSGQQSTNADDWKEASIDLSPYLSSATQFRFRGLVGSSFRSDICIDDFSLARPIDVEGPSILAQPSGANLLVLDSLYLSVVARGFPAPSYQWKRNGVPIPGATGAVYYVASADSSDSGNYTVDITSGSAITSSVAVVTVSGGLAPSISSQPTSVDTVAGDDVVFSILASGTPEPGYQWKKDGVDLNDGNGVSGSMAASLILSDVDADDVGSYTCEVSNAEGSVTSSAATLSVNAPPSVRLLSPSAFAVAIASEHGLVLDAEVSDDGQPTPANLSLSWSKVSGSGSVEFGDRNAAQTTVSFAQADTYVLRLTADDGALSTSIDLQVDYASNSIALSSSIPSGGLLGLWELDAASGVTVVDSSTNSYPDGALVGDPVWLPSDGRFGGALQMDGNGDGVLLEAIGGVNSGGPFTDKTVAGWFKVDDKSVNSRKQVIYEEGGATRGVNLYVFNSRVYVGGWNTPSGESNWSGTWHSSVEINDEAWHHVVLVLDSGTSSVGSDVFKMYLDGALVASGDGSQLWNHNDANSLGVVNGSTLFHDGDTGTNLGDEFAGSVDHVALYNRALSGLEIASLSRSNRSPSISFNLPANATAGNSVMLDAVADDDGLPNPPADLAFAWQVVSGSGEVSFDSATSLNTSAQFDTADTYTLRLFADDGGVKVYRDVAIEILEVVPIVFDQSWKDQAFGEGASGPSTELFGDYDGDGRANIVDYAFQILTTTSGDSVSKLPASQMTSEDSEVFAEIRFRRIEGGAGDMVTNSGYSAGGILYTVQASEGLSSGGWQTGVGLLEQVGTPISNGDGTETVVVRLKSAQDPVSNPQHFLRILLSEAP